MELVKNIFFNTDKLVENTNVKISYVGKLFQAAAEEVYIHYGFGANWDGVNDVKMEKTELGYQAEIELASADTFNFCFKTNAGEWDNNEGENYVFPIEKMELALVVTEPADIAAPKRLSKAYIWNKKIRIAVYKIITYLPKIMSGNYKRKVSEEQ